MGEDTEDEVTPEGSDTQSLLSVPEIFSNNNHHPTKKEIFNRDTILLLGTYLVFQLSNISFNSLYPIFASSPEPTGRALSPEEIGLSLSFAGMVTIVFQVGIFGKLKEKMGNKRTYRAGLFLFFLSMMMMPWVGHRSSNPQMGFVSGKVLLWMELGFVLLVKTVAAVGGLTSALLLVCLPLPLFHISDADPLRSPTQHQITPFLAHLMALPRHCLQLAEQLAPSCREGFFLWQRGSVPRAKHLHGASLAASPS
jgi:hypothetical protein